MIYSTLKTHFSNPFSQHKIFGSPEKVLAKFPKASYVGLTDYYTVSGCVEWVKEAKKLELKPILGSVLKTELGDITVLARNKDGWKDLIKAVSLNSLSLNELRQFSSNWLCLLGMFGDILTERLLEPSVYSESADFPKHLKGNPAAIIENLIQELNLKEVRLAVPYSENKLSKYLTEIYLDVLPEKTVLGCDFLYPNQDDHNEFLILQCGGLKTLKTLFKQKTEGTIYSRYLGNDYHIQDFGSLGPGYDEILHNTEQLKSLFEEYEILSSPQLPKYDTGDKTDYEFLTELCREGWLKRGINQKKDKEVYVERIKEELGVIREANLSSYFIIVADIVNFVKKNNWLAGISRGSAGGCLVSYLTSITELDPIPYNLMFSRFFNSSRLGSLPDIDVDIPKFKREEVINYVKNKYERDRVAQLINFAQFKGASALKEVLRVNDTAHFELMNQMTKLCPEESKIAGMLEESHIDSILAWTLQYKPEIFKDWARLENDKIVGDFAEDFKSAIKLEGTIRQSGRHASAIVIHKEPLNEVVPLIKDKEENNIVALEMNAASDCGLVKLDLLGLRCLDGLMTINDLVKDRY